MQHIQTETQKSGDRPFVSFILTYYDLPSGLLRQCIESIKALSLRPQEREIIVVDDGSKQWPVSELNDLLGDIVYVRQPNCGLSAARNMGLRMASGHYIQFVDADDTLAVAPYEHCLDLARYQHPDMVLFDLTSQPDAEGTTRYDDSATMSGSQLMRSHNVHGSACCYLFRRSIVGDLRFTTGTLHEDEEFTPLLLLRADTIVTTSARAYCYRQRENSIMTADSIRHRLRRLNDAQKILLRLQRKADTLPTPERTALMRRVSQLTMDYIYNVIQLTGNRHYLNRKLQQLGTAGLYPLPKRDYTRKYTWFRRLANSDMGLNVLMRAIPLLKKAP